VRRFIQRTRVAPLGQHAPPLFGRTNDIFGANMVENFGGIFFRKHFFFDFFLVFPLIIFRKKWINFLKKSKN